MPERNDRMPEAGLDFSPSPTLPDRDTAEAIAFGPAYARIKSIKWQWDKIRHKYNRDIADLESQIQDVPFACWLLTHNPMLIRSTRPLQMSLGAIENGIIRNRDRMILRDIAQTMAARDQADSVCIQNLMWARMVSNEAHAKDMLDSGAVGEWTWKSSIRKYMDSPIEYQTIVDIEEHTGRRAVLADSIRAHNEGYLSDYEGCPSDVASGSFMEPFSSPEDRNAPVPVPDWELPRGRFAYWEAFMKAIEATIPDEVEDLTADLESGPDMLSAISLWMEDRIIPDEDAVRQLSSWISEAAT